jgi:hypothetical protein
MSYEHCDEHDEDATNGCPLCILKEKRGAMKITRVLEGERYTAPAEEGAGYRSEIAVEDGFEVTHLGGCFWVSDVLLEQAIEERNRSVPDESLEDVYDDGEVITTGTPLVAAADVDAAEAALVARANERCPRCERAGSKGPCSFDCATCERCKKPIADGTIRVFTTMDRVYCMDCGTSLRPWK